MVINFVCNSWPMWNQDKVPFDPAMDPLVFNQHQSQDMIAHSSQHYDETVRTATPYPGAMNVHPPLALPVTVLLSGFTVTLRG